MYSAQSLHGTVSECPWTHTADIGWLPLALLMTYIFFFNLGYGSMIWITVAEILPIHVRFVLELPCMTSAQRSDMRPRNGPKCVDIALQKPLDARSTVLSMVFNRHN